MVLRTRGAHMSRSKYQRPAVKAWTGKSGQKYWRAEWRVYIDGRPKPKHRVETWLCSEYTKTAAQKACDAMVREETGGPAAADGSLTVAEFWRQIYWPTTKLRVALNTRKSYESEWTAHIEPAIGKTELQHVRKAAVDAILNKQAVEGRAEGSVKHTLSVIHAIFVEAVENGYIARNPAHRVTAPRGKAKQETRHLELDEARRLFALPVDRGSLMYRTMLLTGARVGETLALTKSDMRPGGLLIDESALEGKASTTKNRKVRWAPLPAGLRADLERWAAGVPGELLFPTARGHMDHRGSPGMRAIRDALRAAALIPDLTPRMCRTTFATLFNGDPRDVQGILGHASVDLTMNIYRHPITERQQESVDEMEARFTGRVVGIAEKKRA